MNFDASRPYLSEVTLVAATSVALDATVAALNASMRQARFAEVLLLSDEPPTGDHHNISWRRITRLNSRADYSKFMLRDLADHVGTSHVLCIQWDGFVLNGEAWNPSFLKYDYIGAVWPQFNDDYNVGNGGFSLRSRRLLEACRHLPWTGAEAEDVLIGRICRAQLEEKLINFATEQVARRFSFERTRPTGQEFGFHGIFNLVRRLSRPELCNLFQALEPEVLTAREHRELLAWAAVRGDGRLVLRLLARLAKRKNDYGNVSM